MEAGAVDPNARVYELIARYDGDQLCVADLLCDRYSPEETAFTLIAPDFNASDLSWKELKERSEVLAEGMRSLGIGPGDRVATLMGKSRNLLTTMVAIWRIGEAGLEVRRHVMPPGHRNKSS